MKTDNLKLMEQMQSASPDLNPIQHLCRKVNSAMPLAELASNQDRGMGRHTAKQSRDTCKQHEEDMSDCSDNIQKL